MQYSRLVIHYSHNKNIISLCPLSLDKTGADIITTCAITRRPAVYANVLCVVAIANRTSYYAVEYKTHPSSVGNILTQFNVTR